MVKVTGKFPSMVTVPARTAGHVARDTDLPSYRRRCGRGLSWGHSGKRSRRIKWPFGNTEAELGRNPLIREILTAHMVFSKARTGRILEVLEVLGVIWER